MTYRPMTSSPGTSISRRRILRAGCTLSIPTWLLVAPALPASIAALLAAPVVAPVVAPLVAPLVAPVAASVVAPLVAQERPPADPLPLPPGMCAASDTEGAPPSAPPAERAAQAEALAAEASQAAILGDDARALELLREAVDLDPTSASILYRLGRLLEGAEEEEEAVARYCGYLALTPGGAEAAEVRDRIDRMAGPFPTVDPEAVARAERLAEEQSAEQRAAEQRAAEQRAAEQRAAEQRAAEQRAAEQRAAEEARERNAAAARIDRESEDEASPDEGREGQRPRSAGPIGPTPTTVLITGILMPGMGHIYTGQSQTGLLVLGAAAGSVAAGVLYRRLEVQCLVLPVDGACPEGQERGREESRPLLGPGIAMAAVVTIGGAIHAYLGARDAAPRFSSTGAGRDAMLAFELAREGALLLTIGPPPTRGDGGFRAGLGVRF